MWLLLTIGFFGNVNQNKIDKALDLIREHYSEHVVFQLPEVDKKMYANGLRQFLHQPQYNFACADIIIGDVPGETLNISGYFYNAGNIIVVNDGVLRLRYADFNLDGNIYVLNYGQALADSSTLRFLQDYIYQYGITLVDSAKFILTNSFTSYNGYPFGFAALGYARVIIQNVTNQDWTTAMVSQRSNVFLNNVGITGEWLFADDCFARFHKVDNFLSWYFFPESSIVGIGFPPGDTVYGFHFDSTLGNVQGINYHVEIDSSTNCMWAAIPLKGSAVTIDSSELRVTGLIFQGIDTFALSGLVNGLFYPDWTLPVSDRNYHLINTTVQTWNLYPSDTVNLDLGNSIFGELCAYGNSYAFIHNAFCDGSGGHLEASNNAFLLVAFSSIFADIITKNRGLCIVAYCSMPWGNIWATGASVMIFVNSQFPEDPIPSDTSIVFVAAITGPSNANTDDTVGILGSAWVDKGPFHPLDFGFYYLFYRPVGDSNWIPLGDSQFVEIRHDTLDYWNTVGLSPGQYEVRLVLKDNAGDSTECLKVITLREMGTEEISKCFSNNHISVKQLSPRCFYIENFEPVSEIDIYDLAGRKVYRNTNKRFIWKAPAAGVFFIHGKTLIRKIVAL